MYRFLLSLFLVLSPAFLTAQPALYGLHFARTGNSVPVTGFQRFVQVDPFSGTYAVLDTLTAVRGIVVGSSTFDHSNRRYIFWGIDAGNAKRLYNLDALTGSLLTNPPLSNNPVELQYDLKNGTLYGLNWDPVNQVMNLVTVNLQTGAVTPVGGIAGLRAVAVTGTAFNSNNGTLYLYGTDAAQVKRLYRINASNAQVISSVALNALVMEFQYDVSSNTLYALYRSASSQPLQLAQIDTLTGTVSPVASFPGIIGQFAGAIAGSSTYDQSTGTYIFRGKVGNADSLYAVAVQNGATLANPLIDNVIELEVDNTAFAARRYRPRPRWRPELDKYPWLAFPTPVVRHLTVEMVTGEPLEGWLSLSDLSGRELISRQVHDPKGSGHYELDLSFLQPGVYLLQLKTPEGVQSRKIVKQ